MEPAFVKLLTLQIIFPLIIDDVSKSREPHYPSHVAYKTFPLGV